MAQCAERLALMWSGLPRQPGRPTPMPAMRVSATASANLVASIHKKLVQLESSLGTIKVPHGFLAGALSQLPVAASPETLRIPGSCVELAGAASHLPWHERPGSVRHAVDRLARQRR